MDDEEVLAELLTEDELRQRAAVSRRRSPTASITCCC